MPTDETATEPAAKPKKKHPEKTQTNESAGYLDGLHQEFHLQVMKYLDLAHQQMQLQARVELAEKIVVVTRDHFALAIQNTEGVLPRNWAKTLATARFVGYRLSDACVELVREHKLLTTENLLCYLNNGQFRFRTNAPLREIHGALLKQRSIQKEGNEYKWLGEQPTLRMVEAAIAEATAETKAG